MAESHETSLRVTERAKVTRHDLGSHFSYLEAKRQHWTWGCQGDLPFVINFLCKSGICQRKCYFEGHWRREGGHELSACPFRMRWVFMSPLPLCSPIPCGSQVPIHLGSKGALALDLAPVSLLLSWTSPTPTPESFIGSPSLHLHQGLCTFQASLSLTIRSFF